MSISPPGTHRRVADGSVSVARTSVFRCPSWAPGSPLARHVTPKVTILGFGIAVSVGIGASAIKLLGRSTKYVHAPNSVSARKGRQRRQLQP